MDVVISQATVLPAQPSVYVVDINFAPAGCLATWTAVSADTSAVQLSPASGSGRSQVELFMPANTGAQRSTARHHRRSDGIDYAERGDNFWQVLPMSPE